MKHAPYVCSTHVCIVYMNCMCIVHVYYICFVYCMSCVCILCVTHMYTCTLGSKFGLIKMVPGKGIRRNKCPGGWAISNC